MKTKSAIPNRLLLSAFALILGSFCYLWAEGFDFTPGVHFDDSQKIDAQGVLQIYKPLSGLELIVDSRAAQIRTPIIYHVKVEQSFAKADALKLMEKTLLQEAGIVITHLDDRKVSVTYNDALPIKK